MWINCARRGTAAITLIAVAMLVAGCWDRHEIENRGYVVGIAIDYVDPETSKKTPDLLSAAQPSGKRKYHVTFEMPRFRKKAAGESAGSMDEQHILIAADGESLFEIVRSVSAKIYFPLFFEDLQMIVISEDVAKDGIGNLLDFLYRDPEMRRRAKMFVSPGRAESIFKSKVATEEVISSYVYKMTRNTIKTPTFSSDPNLGNVENAMTERRGFIIPLIITNGEEIKLVQGVLFNRQQKMVGKLTELEVTGNTLLRKGLKQGVIAVPHPNDAEKLVVFELFEHAIKVTPHLQDEHLSFSVQAKLAGNLGERMDIGPDIFDAGFVAAIEQEVAKEYTRLVYAAYAKQQQLAVEGSGLGEAVHHQYPHYWKKIADRWEEEVFPTVPLYVDIKVTVTRAAMTR